MSNGSDMVSSGAFSTAEFDEILGSDGSVDVERLCQASRLGCPPSLRGKVWKYLLGVSRPGRSDDAMSSKRLRNEFIRMQTEQARLPPLAPDILQRLRAEIRRRYAGSTSRGSSPQKYPNDHVSDVAEISSANSDCDADEMERLILLYMANNRSFEDYQSAVYLLSPFLHVLSDQCDVYFCFATLLDCIEATETQGIEHHLAKFMMLFRTFESDLCIHFEDEELRPNEWAIPWLRHFLCKELPLPCVLRLWDAYFADSANMELHMFVCLAILGCCKESLLECEYSELKSSLRHLPDMDMDQILIQASNLQNQVAVAWSSGDTAD